MDDKRSCTDIPWLVILIIVVVLWIALGVYILQSGHTSSIILPKDSTGSRCGMDYHVEDKPFLFFFDIAQCNDVAVPITGSCVTPHMCVENCPNKVFMSSNDNDLKYKKLYCKDYDTKWDEDKCSKWYLPSYPFEGRCIPHSKYYNNQTVLTTISNIRSELTTKRMIENAVKRIKMLVQVREISERVLYAIMVSWWRILIGVLISMVLSILYMLILCLKPTVVIWTSIVFTLIFIGASLCFSVLKYKEYENQTDEISTIKFNLWLSAIVILSVLLFFILISLLVSRNLMLSWIRIAGKGAKLFKQIPTLWMVPVIFWTIHTLLIVYAFSIGCNLATIGQPIYRIKLLTDDCRNHLEQHLQRQIENDSQCEPKSYKEAILKDTNNVCSFTSCYFFGINLVSYHPLLQSLNIIFFVWMISILFSLQQMILSFTFAKWYDSKENYYCRPFWLGVKLSFRYHLGTVALGSMLIAVFRYSLVKPITLYLNMILKEKYELSGRMAQCCKAFIDFCANRLRQIYVHVTTYAYIVCILHGTNFSKSGSEMHYLMTTYSFKFQKKTISFLLFVLKLFITIVNSIICYVLFCTNWIVDNTGVSFPFILVIIIAFCSYTTAMAFFTVNEIAIETMFLRILEQCEQNNSIKDNEFCVPEHLVQLFKT